jgi:hypothetical protein
MKEQTKPIKPLSDTEQAKHDAALRSTGSAEHKARADHGIIRGSKPIEVYDNIGRPEHIVTGLE